MRHLSYLMLMVILSCKGQIDKTDLDYFTNLQFSIDTVIVNPGDEIIFLKHQLSNADISKDGKYLFNFNVDDHTVEKINLDELRLEEKLPFEKEGPNGTGPSVGEMKVQNQSQITIHGMNHIALFSLDGEKLKTIYLENFSLDGAPVQGGEYLRRVRGLNTAATRLYGIIYSYDDESHALGILNLEDFEVSRLELNSFEKMPNFNIIYNSGGIKITHKEGVNIEKFGTKVILSNEITNTLMWYDSEMDSLFIKSYNSQLTANQKEKEYIMEHETLEEFEAEKRRLKQEINFLPPFWDQEGGCFYRFSYQDLPEVSSGDEGIRSKVYLTALDKDLNKLGETLVPQLTKKPGKHFAKDGKIWIYENMNDEMGFVRLNMRKID